MTTLPVNQMTVWQQNASAFAATPDTSLEQTRHAGVRDALKAIVKGHERQQFPERRRAHALSILAGSVERQVRIAGGGTIPLGICPLCGTRCGHGGAS